MSVTKNISFIGGDQRQSFMADYLSKSGFEVIVYGLKVLNSNPKIKIASTLTEALNFANVIIGPIPFSRDNKFITAAIESFKLPISELLSKLTSCHTLAGGCFHQTVNEHCHKNSIHTIDFMKSEEVYLKNTIATAEGAIAEAITKSSINIHQQNCLVLGYGNCGCVIASKLKGIDGIVTICARKPNVLEKATTLGFHTINFENLKENVKPFSFIFNTIPAVILTKEILKEITPGTIIIDIASWPGGADQDILKEVPIVYAFCPGLPGKYAAKTSADILTEALLSNL